MALHRCSEPSCSFGEAPKVGQLQVIPLAGRMLALPVVARRHPAEVLGICCPAEWRCEQVVGEPQVGQSAPRHSRGDPQIHELVQVVRQDGVPEDSVVLGVLNLDPVQAWPALLMPLFEPEQATGSAKERGMAPGRHDQHEMPLAGPRPVCLQAVQGDLQAARDQ